MHSRDHSLKIMKQHCRINAMLHSFACRNVNERNALPKMLFVVNLEPHSRDLLIELIFLSFCLFTSFLGGDEGMGRRQNQFWPASRFPLVCCIFFFFILVFISYCLILIKSQFVRFVCLNNDVNIVLHRDNLHCGLFPETFYYTASPVAVGCWSRSWVIDDWLYPRIITAGCVAPTMLSLDVRPSVSMSVCHTPV